MFLRRRIVRADTLIRTEGMNVLIKNLSLIEAERFVMLIQKETFDYTKWQDKLFEEMTIEEIFDSAAEMRNEKRIHIVK